MIKTNFHTHTVRCRHAEGSDEDYVLKALECGLVELGFSDHSPWPYHPLDSRNIRMDISQMEDYVQHIQMLKRQYANRIHIHLGIEAEYYEARIDQLRELITKYDLEYVLLGNHFHEFETRGRYYGAYADIEHLYRDYEHDSIKAMETGLFDCFVHPDLFCRSLKEWTPQAHAMSERILRKAKELNIPVEYNLGGVRNRYTDMNYPYIKFWEIAAKVGNEVIIGVDAHSPWDLVDAKSIDAAEKKLRDLGITPLEFLKIKKKIIT